MHRTRLFLLALAAVLPATAAERPRTAQAALDLAIYQQGLSLVSEERTLEIGLGPQELVLDQISRRLLPESVQLSGQGLDVRAVNHLPATLTPQSLLREYLGKPVNVVHVDPRGGQVMREPGVLLSAGAHPVVRVGERVEIIDPTGPRRLEFDALPAGLRGRDALVVELTNQTRGPQSLQLTYLTQGLGWQADYVLALPTEGSMAELSGWASIENRTGTDYVDADVRLVAGEPNQPAPGRPETMMMSKAGAPSADTAPQASFDYHVYPLPEPLTLRDEQRKQVRLLAARPVPVEREYRFGETQFHLGAEPAFQSAALWLRLSNEAPSLGMPLPAGIVRVYGQSAEGRPQYLGADSIGHVAAGNPLTLRVGQAFDVTGRRTPLSERRVDQNTVERAWKVELRNAKATPVTVTVAETFHGDWRVLEESQPHRKVSAQQAEWRVAVPAGGQSTLSYRVQSRY